MSSADLKGDGAIAAAFLGQAAGLGPGCSLTRVLVTKKCGIESKLGLERIQHAFFHHQS